MRENVSERENLLEIKEAEKREITAENDFRIYTTKNTQKHSEREPSE